MKYKILADSSCNLLKDYINDKDIGFEVIPLTIFIKDNVFVDNENLNVDLMLEELDSCSEKPTTSCPNAFDFESKAADAENVIIVTISSKLSGSYNSALIAKEELKDKNVFVIDSKATAGSMILIIDKAYQLIKEDKLTFDQICEELIKYRDSLQLLFVLNKFDNLVRNGRMSKAAAFIAKALIIKPLCIADDGEIKVLEKVRTFKGVINRIVYNIGHLVDDIENRVLYICHTKNSEDANELKKLIEHHYKFKDIIVMENRGLCAFYSLEKGLIVSF